MKKLQSFNSLGLMVLGLCLLACQQAPQTKTAPAQSEAESSPQVEQTQTVSLENASTAAMKIDGMMCAMGCAAKIEKNLANTPGILEAKIDFEGAMGKVVFDPELLNSAQIIGVIEQSGKSYKVAEFQVQ